MNPRSNPVRTGLFLIGAGALLVVLGMGLAGLVQPYNRAVAGMLPLLALMGLAVFGSGVHRALWAPPRQDAFGSKALRVVVSIIASVASVMLLSCLTGFVAAMLFATTGHH
jgi:hypothetical protein